MPEIAIQTSVPTSEQGPGLKLLVFCGLGVVAMMFGSLAAWSALAPLESAAVAPGTVAVEFNRKTIKHLEGGIVRRILVAEGERVRAGQTLIELDRTQARAQLELLRGRRTSAGARQARLVAERDGADRITWPDRLSRQWDETRIADIIARQDAIFAARRAVMASQTARST